MYGLTKLPKYEKRVKVLIFNNYKEAQQQLQEFLNSIIDFDQITQSECYDPTWDDNGGYWSITYTVVYTVVIEDDETCKD